MSEMSDIRHVKEPESSRTFTRIQQESIKFDFHSSYCIDFFLLRIPISFNGKSAEIKAVNGELMLVAASDPHPDDNHTNTNTVSAQLSAISLKAVSPVLSKYGVYHLDFFYNKQVPGPLLYSINFDSKSSLKQFLASKETVQKELAIAINSVFECNTKPLKPPPEKTSVDVTCEVNVYLVSPQTVGKHLPKVRQVKLANYPFITRTWEKSKLFDFTNAMFSDRPTDEDDHAELADLQVELKDVIAWFNLGIQLKIPTHELLAIREDYRTTEKCRLEMLIRWEELEKPTWTKLVTALLNIGRRGLAEDLARKYGLPQSCCKAFVSSTGVETSVSSKLLCSELNLSLKTKELERAKLSKNVTSKKLEREIEDEVPLLQEKVKSLTTETKILKEQLKNRNKELQMFEEFKPSLGEDELEFLESLVKEKSEQVKTLKDELSTKEMKLDENRIMLWKKDKQLSRLMEELSSKSAQVVGLEEEMEKLQQNFNEQQEEMNERQIEASAASVSQEKLIEELQLRQEIAVKQANQMKEEIKCFNQELATKEEEIHTLTKKIGVQEREMNRLRQELISQRQHTSQEFPEVKIEEISQDLHTLTRSTIELKLQLKRAKDEKIHERMDLERAKKSLERYERIALSSSQRLSRKEPWNSLVQNTLGKSMSALPRRRTKTPPMKTLSAGMETIKKSTDILKWKPDGLSLSNGTNRTLKTKHHSSGIKLLWKSVKSAPCKMTRATDVAVDDGLVYFRQGHTRHLFMYNSTTNTWSQLPDSPTAYCSIAVVKTLLTTIGGRLSNGECTNQVFSIIGEGNGQRWEEVFPPMLTQQSSTIAVSIETHLIVAGKYWWTSVEVMDTESYEWSMVSTLPQSYLESLIVCNKYTYSVHDYRGVFQCKTSSLIEMNYDEEEENWSELKHTGVLQNSAFVSFHNRLLSVGGRDSNHMPTTAIMMYSPNTNKWEVIGHMKLPRWSCFASVLPNNKLMIVGGYTTPSRQSVTSNVEMIHIIC